MQPRLVVLEPTGGLERLVVAHLSTAKLPVSLPNPRKIRAYATVLGKAKTDSLDAKVLPSFGQKLTPAVSVLIDQETQQLADLVTRRRQLVEMQVAETNRLSRAPAAAQANIKEHLAQLKAHLNQLDEQIETLTKSDHWKAKRALLRSTPGIGSVTSAVYLSELPELGHLSEKKIARLVGKVALTACMHKLLTILNAMMRDNQPWQSPAVKTV